MAMDGYIQCSLMAVNMGPSLGTSLMEEQTGMSDLTESSLSSSHLFQPIGDHLNKSFSRIMMISGCCSEVNPNAVWLNHRGIWLSYFCAVAFLHSILLSFPFLSVPWVWTGTNIIHNLANFILLHLIKGTPWETGDQGIQRELTHWEQIDEGTQWTATRKFLTIFPVFLFLFASFYTNYQFNHFVINGLSLLSVTLPKLPQFHLVRIFGINKY